MKPVYDFPAAKRGAILKTSPGITGSTLRLDQNILDQCRTRFDEAGGENCACPLS